MDAIPHFPLMIADLSDGNRARHEIFSPYDNHLIATAELAGAAEVEQALTVASGLFHQRKWLPVVERIAILQRVISMMEEQASLLALGAAEEGGKPLVDSEVEMARCMDSLRLCIDALRNDAPSPVPMGINPASRHRLTMMRREPIGVVVAISAFNHPLNLIAHQIGPAIASGCPVIVKPAESTPLSCFRLVELFHRAGLPPAWCQALLTEDHATAEMLATDRRVAFLSFIGSARVGWHLRSRLAPGTRCALEHGGVAPVIVAGDADIDAAVPGLAKGAFYHAGQVCVSVQRIYAHRSVARQLAENLATAARQMKVGDPLSGETEVGPIIRRTDLNRIASWVQEAVDMGAELLCGGQELPYNCYAPTVLFNPPPSARVSMQEVFGPVLCLYTYDDIDEAIESANSLDFAFQAAVYTRDIDMAMTVSERLAASAVMVNEHTAFRVDWMPFAGLRHSGLGTGGIAYTMRDMQVEKMVVLTSTGIRD